MTTLMGIMSAPVDWRHGIVMQRNPMTILGAYQESPERIIVTADRLAVSIDGCGVASGGGETDKWHQVRDLPLMWAWCGSGFLEDTLEAWITADFGTQLPRWADIYAVAGRTMKALNTPVGQDRYADIMVAGFLGGEAGILTANATGYVNFPDGEIGTKARFMGLSCNGASLAWEAICDCAPGAATPDNFRRIVELVAERDPRLWGASAWAITPQGYAPVPAADQHV